MNWLRANFYKACTIALLILAASAATSSLYYRSKAKLAVAGLEVAEAQRDKARFIATQVIEFNAGFQRTTQTLRTQLMTCQAGVRKAKQDNDNAVSRWMAEAKDADATLKKFVGQFEAKGQGCESALSALDRACPALAGY